MSQPASHTAHSSASPANGASTLQDLFGLTDEQILEIEPDGQGEVASDEWRVASEGHTRTSEQREARNVVPASLPADSAGEPRGQHGRLEAGATNEAGSVNSSAADNTAVGAEIPPQWLAERMADPQAGGEAREFWKGIQQARQETAAYRAAFASPEDAQALKELYPGGVAEARAAVERSRLLEDIDRAYFGAAGGSPEQTSAARAQLAQRMLREDPAAFREMVSAGLRALEEAGASGTAAGAHTPRLAKVFATEQRDVAPQARTDTSSSEAHAAYVTFERAANQELERTVGDTISRALSRALPGLAQNHAPWQAGAQSSLTAAGDNAAPLQEKLASSIRGEVEKALQSDRQLGEQVAQVMAARRFDDETRAQVVRLIAERAQQLVPGATRRVLNQWTQTTLAAHRGSGQGKGNAGRDDLAARETGARISSSKADGNVARSSPTAAVKRNEREGARSGRFDYRTLSDEQILDL